MTSQDIPADIDPLAFNAARAMDILFRDTNTSSTVFLSGVVEGGGRVVVAVEPTALAIFGAGLAALGWAGRRRNHGR
ncbi:MAG: hypothetical protein WD673_03865 [Alphaproteobacteria bacterium]